MRLYKKKRKGSLWPVCVLLLTLTLVTGSCGILRPSKQAQIERRQAKEAQKAQAEYDKAIEAHMKNQSDGTRKMMKKTKKKAKGFNKFMKKSTKRSPGC
jgi:type II secretory pathway pseudopilin PulG